MQLLVSLHDVTPFHAARLERAERLLVELGVSEAIYLLVPNYHGIAPAAGSPRFTAWCRKERPFFVHWALHGYYHREYPNDPRRRDGPATRLKRSLLTGGEAECLGMDERMLRARLALGCEAFAQAVGRPPEAFVAPAWLFDRALLPALADAAIRYTEDHARLYDLQSGSSRACPVITWATRTMTRRVVSRIVSRGLPLLWSRHPTLRIALHPFDFDHPDTTAALRDVLSDSLKVRSCAGYSDVFAVRHR